MGSDVGDSRSRRCRGDALVGYRSATAEADGARLGRRERPTAVAGVPQVEFEVDDTGGRETRWRRVTRVPQRLPAVRRPAARHVVTGCKAPDGSYWALQRWQRLAADARRRPVAAGHTAVELHLSHWTGPLPARGLAELDVRRPLAGPLRTADVSGEPVHGFRTPSRPVATPTRRSSTSTRFNSPYGPGWKPDTGDRAPTSGTAPSVTASSPQALPPGLSVAGGARAGNGERHRVTHGPGRHADRGSGRMPARPLRPRPPTARSTRSSTGSSAPLTRLRAAAVRAGSGPRSPSRPSGSSARRRPTPLAPRAALRGTNPTAARLPPRSPSNTASTVPSRLFRTQPATPADPRGAAPSRGRRRPTTPAADRPLDRVVLCRGDVEATAAAGRATAGLVPDGRAMRRTTVVPSREPGARIVTRVRAADGAAMVYARPGRSGRSDWGVLREPEPSRCAPLRARSRSAASIEQSSTGLVGGTVAPGLRGRHPGCVGSCSDASDTRSSCSIVEASRTGRVARAVAASVSGVYGRRSRHIGHHSREQALPRPLSTHVLGEDTQARSS